MPPYEGIYIWDCFTDLHRKRSYNASGPNPISFEGLQAYQRTYGLRLRPWESSLIMQIDDVYLEESYKKSGNG